MMKKPILKPRRKMTKAHVKRIAEAFQEIYGDDSFVAGFLAAKGKLPDHRNKICTKCFKLLPSGDFGAGRPDCRRCR